VKHEVVKGLVGTIRIDERLDATQRCRTRIKIQIQAVLIEAPEHGRKRAAPRTQVAALVELSRVRGGAHVDTSTSDSDGGSTGDGGGFSFVCS
jgi:hypothetical protein